LDVSVFILSYKRPHYLREAVRSVLAQSRKPKAIVILDNGSGEDVKRAVLDFLEQGVTWEGSETTHSSLWNIQRAFDNACLKYAYVMHDDDRLCPRFLETQVEFMEEHSMAAAVACGAYLIDSNGNRIGRLADLASSDTVVHWFNSGAEVAAVYSRGGCLPFPSILYRASSLRKVRVRSNFGKVADVVLLCELADVGPIAYRNVELLEYRVHPGQDSADFPEHVFWKLDCFLVRKGSTAPALAKDIYNNIRRLETGRYLSKWILGVKRDRSPNSVIDGVRLVMKPYFSWKVAVRLLLNRLRTRVHTQSLQRCQHTPEMLEINCLPEGSV
jgi:glycosyltransferase involved in cell wall biosynthesis